MAWPAQVLIVAQESSEREKLHKIFNEAGVRTFCCSTLLEAQSFLSAQSVSAVFAETSLPDGDFQAIRKAVGRSQNDVPIVALSWNMEWDSYLAAMSAGAFDCLSLPSNILEAKRVLWSALQSYFYYSCPTNSCSLNAEEYNRSQEMFPFGIRAVLALGGEKCSTPHPS